MVDCPCAESIQRRTRHSIGLISPWLREAAGGAPSPSGPGRRPQLSGRSPEQRPSAYGGGSSSGFPGGTGANVRAVSEITTS